MLLILGIFGTSITLAVTGATPAFAAGTYTCTAPASGGTSTTFIEGSASSYSVACYGKSGVSGTTAYPASITLASGTLPPGATEATSTSSSPACTTSTSGSGTSEEYILTCAIADNPTPAQAGSYPVTFTANPGTDGGAATTSGTLTISVAPATLTCTAPASGGSSTTFDVGVANTYAVSCYEKTGVSGIAAYPASITLAGGTLPSDATEATSTSSSPACTTATSGSGTSEEYILNCNIAETPTLADVGSYPGLTFTATGSAGVTPVTTGALTLTVANAAATACSAPASGGTSSTFTVGTASSYSVACYGTTGASYPPSITIASGTLPTDAAFPTTVGQGCTQSTSGSGATEEYILTCKITETPTATDEGTYPLTFSATGAGGPTVTSGTLTLKVAQTAPTWVSGQYTSAIKNVPFCVDVAVSNAAALPLTSITAGTVPSGITNYSVQNVNLAAGTAQVCGTDTNTPATSGTPPALAPVATNTGGSATDSIPIGSQNECTWTASQGTVSMFDANQDLEQAGSQSAFGQPISNGETVGTTSNYPTCTGDVVVAASGGLGDAFTVNTANPLPTPTDTNGGASQDELASSNLELAKGCYGSVNILSSYSYTSMGTGYKLTLPSPWVNGGDCSYGGVGSNSAGGNTDTTNATCPPSQADVNEGYVSCSITVSSGNDENGQANYSTMDLFFNGQPVPQQSTATLSAGGADAGSTVSVTGGTNWWGAAGGAPNSGPYGDFQSGAMYQVSAPGVFIGTSRGTAVPVVNSTVTIPGNQYVCTGAQSTTVGPNPCTMTPGQPTGSFQIPSGLAAGLYNVYIDETNTTPLPGNGPNDAYQTARGTNLGTAESVTQIAVGPPAFTSAASTTFSEAASGTFAVTAAGDGPITYTETGALPTGVTLASNGTLAGTPAPGTAGSYPITITATDAKSDTTSQSFTLTVNPSAPVFTSATSASFGENSAGTFAVTATGDTPITFTEAGALPTGVTLGSDGTLAGTPAFGTAGTYPVTITATDANSATATQAFTLTVTAGGPVFTSAGSTSFAENQAGTFSVTVTGDTPITYSESGALPAGVTLGSDGTLSGTPAFGTAGSYPVTITATDANSNTSTQSFTLTVTGGGPVFTSAASTSFAENQAGTFSVTATGDTPITFTETGALPTGVTLGSDGTLSGTPAFGTAGSYPITITATDTNSNTSTQAFTLTVTAGGPVFTSAGSTTFAENAAGSFPVTATGDTPITFTETGALPAGVTLGSDGTLSGTPAFGTAGTYPITITATDANSATVTQSFTLTVTAGGPVFTSTGSATFAENQSGTFAVTATGDTPISYTETGALPTGVTLGSDGTLAGTPGFGTAGSYPVTITATDTNSATATQSFTLTVTTGGPVFTSATSTTFSENDPGTFAVTATGDTPITFTETGALPTGVTLAPDGILSGTPDFGTAGSYPVTITATDTNSGTATQAFTLTVNNGVLVFTSAASTTFSENDPGTFAVTADGDNPITFTEVGPLPTGVTLGSDGTLAGAPAFGTAGSYPVTITATDGNANTLTQSFTLTVTAGGPVFTSAGSTTFAENQAGSFPVTATGDAPITFTEVGTLPTGVTLGSDGTLSGTPAFGTAGSYPVTITATDTNSNAATQSFTLTVTAGAPVFTSGASTTFHENQSGTFAVTATGDTPITFTEVGTLPTGVTLASNGTLSGTPAFGTAGTYPVAITATDANSTTSTQAFTLTVTAGGPVFTSASSTTFAENQAGTFSVTATGDTPITFAEAGALPTGVTLASNGTLAGTPAFGTAGTYPVTITATDANSATATQSFTLTVTAGGPVFTSGASTTFHENQSGTFAVTATGDTPITFTETGALPTGVTLASNGTLAGTPAFGTAGSYPVTITATDGHSNTSTQSFTLTVTASAPAFTSGASTTFHENQSGTFAITATGDTPITYSEAGALPTGVTLASNGTLAGTPAFGTAGSYPVTIKATDAHSTTSTQSFTLTVTASAPVFTSGASTTFHENQSGTFAVTATGDGPITYSETGALPTGVTLASNGTLSGTPAFGTAGSYPVTIKATDTHSNAATQSFTLTVTASAPVFTSAASTTFTALNAGSFAVTATGDTPITYTEAGTLPTGVTLASNGTLAGTPATGTAGSYPVTIKATDAHSNAATQFFTLTVASAPTTTVAAPSSGTVEQGSFILDASAGSTNGVSKVQYEITGGSYTDSVIGTASASIFGWVYTWNTTTVPDGAYTVQSVVTDTLGNTGTSAGITIVVDNAPPTTAVVAPASGSVEHGSFILDANSSSAHPISKIQYEITGGSYTDSVIGTASASIFGWVYTWNTTTVPDGAYTVQSVATDSLGGTGTSAGITIVVDNSPPTTAVLSPASGSTEHGSVVLDATSSSVHPISKIQYEITGGSYADSVIGTASASIFGWVYTWNTATVPNGTYTLQTVATDSLGGTGTSAGITVIIHN
jgi:hypothetical protein